MKSQNSSLVSIILASFAFPMCVMAGPSDFHVDTDLANSKHYQQIIDDNSRIISADPKNARAHDLRGMNYRRLGQYEKAVADYTRAIELNANDSEAYTGRGLARCGGLPGSAGQPEIDDWTTAIGLDRKSTAAYVYRGIAYQMARKHEKAIVDYKMAIKLDPTSELGKCAVWNLRTLDQLNQLPPKSIPSEYVDYK
jgi:tetratricopeptide (TPR) repeat protein